MSSFIDQIEKNKNTFFSFLHLVSQQDKKLLIVGDLFELLRNNQAIFKEESQKELAKIISIIQEMVFLNHSAYCDVREKIASSQFFCFNLEESAYEQIPLIDFLKMKEAFINQGNSSDILTINFEPFYKKFPSVKDIKNVGNGIEYLNRYLSSQMFNDADRWRILLLDFLKKHKYEQEQLIINDRISTVSALINGVEQATRFLNSLPPTELYENIRHKLQDLGFEAGLGLNVNEILRSIKLLDSLLQSPDHIVLTEFLTRIPMIFRIAIISPHGFFAQHSILGLPDSGGQIVYILDQVKALEKALMDSLKRSGLNIIPKIIILTRLIPNPGKTTCNKHLEKVLNTKNSWILRVPFRTHNQRVTDNWISRFEIWPYLEEFAEDAGTELIGEFGGKPDFIIGNYSDGNLVAYLLAKKFHVTQCCIAHALEKSKYLFSALYWKGLEQYYNFSIQFTADLLAMNSADFIITSTYQEIRGTEDSLGQYESYIQYTMPELYRVESGINLYHPKFNVVSPGVNEKVFFPYTKSESRIDRIRKSLNNMLFGNTEDANIFGKLEKPELRPLFTMARLDKVKNVTSFVRWFGESKEMQELCNIIVIAGKIDPSESSDNEEIEEIKVMHDLIQKHNLSNKIRWIGKVFRKDEAGELYRIIADHKGIFIQSGLFEGFGLTVLEAMISGLPVFATKYGGPQEIIQDSINGFHIDPVNHFESTQKILDFLNKLKEKPDDWNKISQAAIKRVYEAFHWKLYADKLLSLSKIYSFWRFVKDIEMSELNSYLELLYYLLLKPRAKDLLEKHNRR